MKTVNRQPSGTYTSKFVWYPTGVMNAIEAANVTARTNENGFASSVRAASIATGVLALT